jgi:hypothetical protein
MEGVNMDKMLKESVATLFCYAIKLGNKDLIVEKPLFCRLMEQSFDCDSEEAEEILYNVIEKEQDCTNVDTHISIISNALYNEPFAKMNILKQLNHIIFISHVKSEDYQFFEKVQRSFFAQ